MDYFFNKTQHVREERWREYSRMMVLQQVNKLETNCNGTCEIQDHIGTLVALFTTKHQFCDIDGGQKEMLSLGGPTLKKPSF